MPQSWPGGQPKVWTFIDFEAPDDMAEELAHAIPDVLKPDFGWWADFRIGDNEHVIIYADRVIRYRIGDEDGRAQAVAWGRSIGTPEAQLDWRA